MKTVEELIKMQKFDFDNEEDTLFVQFRDNEYDQKTLRQFSTKNFWNFMEDFWALIAHNKIYDKDFIIQMFSKCSKDERKQIDILIRGQFQCLIDSLNPKDPPYIYMPKLLKYKEYIINTGHYLRFCKSQFCHAKSMYQFFEQNLNICMEQIFEDYDQYDFIVNKKIYE